MTKEMMTHWLRRLMKNRSPIKPVPELSPEQFWWLLVYIDLMEQACGAESNLRGKHTSLLNADGMSQHGGRARAFYCAQEKLSEVTRKLSDHCGMMNPAEEILDQLGRA